jgi:hypothetical protein
MRLTRIAILTAIAVALGSCGVKSDLAIVNDSGEKVQAVSISDGRNVWDIGDLRTGQTVKFDGKLSGEGGPLIAWTYLGQQYSEHGCYYSDSYPGTPAEGRIFIEGEQLRFRCT